MSAISDYLEGKLLNFLFRNDVTFVKPSNISIALLNTVPGDNATGATMDEVVANLTNDAGAQVPTQYARISLGNPSVDGNTWWKEVGEDNNSAFYVYTAETDNAGYYYPLYLSLSKAATEGGGATKTLNFVEFPGVDFYMPDNGTGTEKAENNPDPQEIVYRLYDGNGFIQNKKTITFERVGQGGWGTIKAVALMDSSTYGEGNILMYSALEVAKQVDEGDVVQFIPSSLEISLK